MTSVIVSIITVAIITVLVTRPGVAEFINRLSAFMMASIKALLGVDYE